MYLNIWVWIFTWFLYNYLQCNMKNVYKVVMTILLNFFSARTHLIYIFQ